MDKIIKNSFGVLVILVLFSVAAWLPLALHYRMLADDFLNSNLDPGSVYSFANQGIWRWLGFRIIYLALNTAPGFYTVLLAALHGINCWFLYLLLRWLCGPRAVLLAGTCFLASFPGYYEAVGWVAASGNVWSVTVFLLFAALCSTVEVRTLNLSKTRCFLFFVLAAFAAFLGNMTWEQLCFCYAAFPVVVLGLYWTRSKKDLLSIARKLWPLCGAWLGVGLYVLIYQMTSTTASVKKPSFHVLTLLNTYYYPVSYTHLTLPTIYSV